MDAASVGAHPIQLPRGNPAWRRKPCGACGEDRDPRTGGRRLLDGRLVRVCQGCKASESGADQEALFDLYGRTAFAVLALAATAMLWYAMLLGGVRGYHQPHPLALAAAPIGAIGLIGMADLRMGAFAAAVVSLSVVAMFTFAVLGGFVGFSW